MNIRLRKLRIENFKGCRERTIDFGAITNIYGANASGKTTIADAFQWLMFGKDSTGATKFSIRPLGADGKTIDNVEIKVEATLAVDGVEITLQKVQKQNWVKKRGTDTASLQGNVDTYEIDSFPASEKEFKEKITGIIDEKLFGLLTNPRNFAALPWKEQRSILMKFISEITDADVLATDPAKYAPIADEVNAAPIEKCIEKAKKAMTSLKDRQKELPARIDEVSKSLVDVPELADLELHRNALNEQLEEIQKQKDDTAAAYKAVGDIQAEIMQTKLEIGGVEREAHTKVQKALRDARTAHDGAQAEEQRLFRQKQQKAAELEELRRQLDDKEEHRSALGAEYSSVRSETLPASATICPTCGQELPEDKVEEIRSGFAAKKAQRLQRIIADGNALKAECDRLRTSIPEAETALEEIKSTWTAAMQATGKTYEYMNSLPTKVDLSTNQEYQALRDKLSGLEMQLGNMDTGEAVKQQLAIKERGIREQLDAVNRQFAAVEANERARERIDELKAEQRTVGQQVAGQEKKILLLENFSRAKIEMLSSAINSQFKAVSFKMFEMQINGGMKETCEMTVDGVPYSSLNSAAKMQAGLDVIGALSRLYDVTTPIFLDNRESVSEIPEVPGQIINLFVSAGDKELRVEVE